MGLPFVVLNMVSVLMFSGLGISDTQIAFWTSLIMLPWTLKPLWSPFVGMFKTKKFFVALTQILSGTGFFLVALSLHLPHFFAISIALFFIVAFSGATHDIAADGVYMSLLSKSGQAEYIGWQGAFYNLAKIAATGGLVYLAGSLIEKWGAVHAWAIVMSLCGAILLLLGLYHIKALPSGAEMDKKAGSFRESMDELWDVINTFFAKKQIIWYIGFILLYRLAEGFVIKIVPLFLNPHCVSTAANRLIFSSHTFRRSLRVPHKFSSFARHCIYL
ncbi:hypothetical protein FACS189413_07230 [Bacteroidia bacterium]|nr:hypothetical protein FACS189413_07230 [Bacteroidia bacterium]